MQKRQRLDRKSYKKLATALWVVATLVWVNRPAYADTTELFPSNPEAATPIEMQISLPVRKLRNSDRVDPEEFSGEIRLLDGTLIPVKISARGKSRRNHCKFPPLRLNFSKASTKNTIFEGQNKLKLVSHCGRVLARGSYLASEMLAYRMLNLTTDVSFRVRALKVTYLDTTNARTETRHAFLIEHKKRLAHRLGLSLVQSDSLRLSKLNAEQASLIAVYQYMIGNTDYSLRRGPPQDSCCHNVVPLSGDRNAATDVISIPYDFDASGLVDAPYAEPPEGLNLSSVKQRRFRGYCAHNASLSGAIDSLAAQKEAFAQLVAGFSDVPGLARKRTQRYLDAFFSVIEDSRKRDRQITRRCNK